MGIKAIDYENLSEGDLITWYGMHVLRWEDEIRPYGIEPSIAFVQDDTQEILIGELLDALKATFKILEHNYGNGIVNGYWPTIAPVFKQAQQAIAKAEGK